MISDTIIPTRVTLLALLSLLINACSPAPTSPTGTVPATPRLIFPTLPACTTLTLQPTPGPDEPSLIPSAGNADRARGNEDAYVTITTYLDYQDSRSKYFFDVANQLLAEYPEDLRTIYRLFPLIGNLDKSALAAQAAEAADEQGKFWEMNDLLFSKHKNWINLTPADFERWITAQASTMELNMDQFKSDFTSEGIVARVNQFTEDGNAVGIPGTPLILINGQIYSGPRDHGSLRDILELILLGRRQFTSCPPLTVQTDKQYIVTLHTAKGEIVFQLYADKAPITVNSFLFLARNGWYDDTTFHRVIPDLFALTGDPSGTGEGGPGYYIVTEINPSLKFDRPGVVAMVNSGPDAGGSQFFITYAASPQFDGQYTIIGQVLSGMDVLESLAPRDAQPGTETPPGDMLLTVTIEER